MKPEPIEDVIGTHFLPLVIKEVRSGSGCMFSQSADDSACICTCGEKGSGWAFNVYRLFWVESVATSKGSTKNRRKGRK